MKLNGVFFYALLKLFVVVLYIKFWFYLVKKQRRYLSQT